MPKAVPTKRGANPSGRSKKAKKDPNAPKRGLSAYMFYANANRDRVRSENPDITFGQVGKTLGEEWKALEAPEKAKYEEMAKKDKKRYEDAKAAYNADADDDEGSE